jgi:Coenzyme F420-reducing hydrogenase, alpha subunit
LSDEDNKRRIEIPEICRVEGHASVYVDIEGNEVRSVKLDVFEGTRFFERLVVGHHYKEIPHITSRVCAICSTGHVLAAIRAIEKIAQFKPSETVELFRELMHLGMIIESNSTHIYALALPDFLGFSDVHEFAVEHKEHFMDWTKLRNLGSTIQTILGGRPFHPVNLHVGGFSSFPQKADLIRIVEGLKGATDLAIKTCELLMQFKPPVERTTEPVFLALIPSGTHYGYFGDKIRSSTGKEMDTGDYASYLKEEPVPYSHAKRSSFDGKPIMVGSLARLSMFSDRLGPSAESIYRSTSLARGDTNTIWNNLGQAIEIVEAIERAITIASSFIETAEEWDSIAGRKQSLLPVSGTAGSATGAVECPRGTLYHHYQVDERGFITLADMITPSAQNTYRIERDIHEVVSMTLSVRNDQEAEKLLKNNLETLVRAYDPCNTCATHMVAVKYSP